MYIYIYYTYILITIYSIYIYYIYIYIYIYSWKYKLLVVLTQPPQGNLTSSFLLSLSLLKKKATLARKFSCLCLNNLL